MSKSNKLTVWIFIALVIGVITGAILNSQYPAPPVKTYEEAIASLDLKLKEETDHSSLSVQLEKVLADSTLDQKLKWEKTNEIISKERKRGGFAEVALKAASREESMNPVLKNILEVISILTDIFLRLIKMIIAPLVAQ